MNLYLIRHAEAASLGEGGMFEDADRPLTDRGQAQSKLLATGLARHGVQLGAVVTSPLLRARQTAEALLEHWPGTKPELRVCEALAPPVRRKKLSRYLQELGANDVALVGHQPDLGEYTAWLIGSRKAQVEFPKGGVAYVLCGAELEKGAGTLLWLVSPEWLGEGEAD